MSSFWSTTKRPHQRTHSYRQINVWFTSNSCIFHVSPPGIPHFWNGFDCEVRKLTLCPLAYTWYIFLLFSWSWPETAGLWFRCHSCSSPRSIIPCLLLSPYSFQDQMKIDTCFLLTIPTYKPTYLCYQQQTGCHLCAHSRFWEQSTSVQNCGCKTHNTPK